QARRAVAVRAVRWVPHGAGGRRPRRVGGRGARSMITDVDTNVLLDVLIPDAPQQEQSAAALAAAAGSGALIIGEPVYAELAAYFPDGSTLTRFIADTGLRLVPTGPDALAQAGRAWRRYRQRRPTQLACPQCGT